MFATATATNFAVAGESLCSPFGSHIVGCKWTLNFLFIAIRRAFQQSRCLISMVYTDTSTNCKIKMWLSLILTWPRFKVHLWGNYRKVLSILNKITITQTQTNQLSSKLHRIFNEAPPPPELGLKMVPVHSIFWCWVQICLKPKLHLFDWGGGQMFSHLAFTLVLKEPSPSGSSGLRSGS